VHQNPVPLPFTNKTIEATKSLNKQITFKQIPLSAIS